MATKPPGMSQVSGRAVSNSARARNAAISISATMITST